MKIKNKINKKQVMNHYYSDDELKDMMKLSVNSTLRWLEEARRFFSRVTPEKTKKLQEKMILEGW